MVQIFSKKNFFSTLSKHLKIFRQKSYRFKEPKTKKCLQVRTFCIFCIGFQLLRDTQNFVPYVTVVNILSSRISNPSDSKVITFSTTYYIGSLKEIPFLNKLNWIFIVLVVSDTLIWQKKWIQWATTLVTTWNLSQFFQINVQSSYLYKVYRKCKDS